MCVRGVLSYLEFIFSARRDYIHTAVCRAIACSPHVSMCACFCVQWTPNDMRKANKKRIRCRQHQTKACYYITNAHSTDCCFASQSSSTCFLSFRFLFAIHANTYIHTNSQTTEPCIDFKSNVRFPALHLTLSLCFSLAPLPLSQYLAIAIEMPQSVCALVLWHFMKHTATKCIWMCLYVFAIDMCYWLLLWRCVGERLLCKLCCVNKVCAQILKLIVVILPTFRSRSPLRQKCDAFIYFHMEWYICMYSLFVFVRHAWHNMSECVSMLVGCLRVGNNKIDSHADVYWFSSVRHPKSSS